MRVAKFIFVLFELGLVNTPMLRSFFSPPALLRRKLLLTPREAACNILRVIKRMDDDQHCSYFVGATPAKKRLSRFLPKDVVSSDNGMDNLAEVESLYHDAFKSLPHSTLMSISKSLDVPITELKTKMRSHSSIENMDTRIDALKMIKNDIMLAMR